MDDAPTGPPLVVTHTRSNTCSAPMTDKNTDTRTVGPSSGSVTWRNTSQLVAPSMDAASFSSFGTCCKPASIRIMWIPKYFHDSTKNST